MGVGVALMAPTGGEALAQRRAHFNPYAQFAPVYPGAWGYAADPYHGVADVIRAVGDVLYKREEIISKRLDNRRKAQEHWLWERDNLPTPEEERERLRKQLTDHSRNDPTVTEIWSAEVLNYLLKDIRQRPNYYATATPLDPDMLAKINITSGKRGVNFGMLKGGKVNWPLPLRRPAFTDDRQTLDQLVARAVNQAAAGQMDVPAIDEMTQRLKGLQNRLTEILQSAKDDTLTPGRYGEAQSFLKQFLDAVRVLELPDAGQFINGTYAAKGQTVGDLVEHMSKQGLWFAPATPGTETAYTALHKAMSARP